MHYSDLITTPSELHQSAQAGAAKSVNRFLVLRNWLYGACLDLRKRAFYENEGIKGSLGHFLRAICLLRVLSCVTVPDRASILAKTTDGGESHG